jgi:hypothetical protein
MPDAGSCDIVLGAEEDPSQTNLVCKEYHDIAVGSPPQLIGAEQWFHIE